MTVAPARTLDAVIAGYLGVDIAPGFPRSRAPVPLSELLRPGKLIETQGLGFSLGGAVANTGLAMKKFGQRIALMGLVGQDALGDLALAQLREHGVTAGIRRTDRAGTAYGIVLAPPGTDRMFLEDPGCNAVFCADDLDLDTVARSRLFHFGYPPLMKRMFDHHGAELVKMFTRVRSLGVATSLDLTLPDPDGPAGQADWPAILAEVLPHVDVFVPSLEEILFMLEPSRYSALLAAAAGGDITDAVPEDLFDRLGDRLLALGVNVLMIKAGHRGAYLRTGELAGPTISAAFPAVHNCKQRRLWAPPFTADPARIRNACGAGDCAVAGFLAALLNGESLAAAGRYAMLAGRDNLYGDDAISGLSDWDRMTKVVRGAAASGPQ